MGVEADTELRTNRLDQIIEDAVQVRQQSGAVPSDGRRHDRPLDGDGDLPVCDEVERVAQKADDRSLELVDL